MLTAGYSYASAERVAPRRVVVPRRRRDPRAARLASSPSWFAARGMPLERRRCARAPARAASSTTSTSRRILRSRSTGTGRGAPVRAPSCSPSSVLAPHYADLMDNDLPAILRGDVQDYDTARRVRPAARAKCRSQLGGPTTRTGLAIWLCLAVAGLATSLVLALRRKRGVGLVMFGADRAGPDAPRGLPDVGRRPGRARTPRDRCAQPAVGDPGDRDRVVGRCRDLRRCARDPVDEPAKAEPVS